MARNGDGNAWRHRQRSHRGGLFGTPRVTVVRKLLDEPQFRFADLYISPFRWKRQYSVDGVVSYVDMPKPAPTGIRMLDAYLRYLADGNSDLQAFADAHGLRREDIDSMIFILTGMRGVDFRLKFQLTQAAELLRYTSMSLAEVSRRSGIGSANNLYLAFKRDFNLAPGYWRLQVRQEGDLDRYRL